jgi:hypothetical protein
MQVPQQVLQQMIEENAEIAEAEKMGITVSDNRQSILRRIEYNFSALD